ncbi:hypothetical protein JOD45_002752 [Scopulibacillus daqui]|uniref:Spore germination protein GerPA/GerPF n=1 Tax=Scopulibacillus daqui TaxID=1469162 RepID=A0ABS2Q4V2_9BACL|nr:hypothetical protein [Scopulibacillus daqui]MBM7646522.1 hypothetical protein [Scopulibacillus daqui]
MKIKFDELKIEQVTKSSGVFSGKNLQDSWVSIGKENQGFGDISGINNKSRHHMNIVNDQDNQDVHKE